MALSIDQYEYMDEDVIDDNLKCIICTQPFQSPISLACQHTFCQFCIETWIKTNSSCPICRRSFGIKYEVTKVTNSSVINELDGLLVRCLRCKKINIKRNNFKKHWQRCSKSRTARLSDSVQNRWCSMKRTFRSKYNRQAAISHQIRVTHATEFLNTNHEQQDVYRPQTTYSRQAIDCSQERTEARYSNETSRLQREAVFCVFIIIATILCLITFGSLIIFLLQNLGKLVIVLLCLYLWIKLR
jgi:hypothetical protein